MVIWIVSDFRKPCSILSNPADDKLSEQVDYGSIPLN